MKTNHSSDTITVKITPNDRGNPAGKLADAELHFGGESPLAGLKLIGFSIWERRGGNGRNVTFPARSYAANGERRSFALPCAAVGSRVGAVVYRRAHLLPSLSVDGASLATPSLRLRPPPHRTGQADFPHPARREGVIPRGYASVRTVRAFALAYARR